MSSDDAALMRFGGNVNRRIRCSPYGKIFENENRTISLKRYAPD